MSSDRLALAIVFIETRVSRDRKWQINGVENRKNSKQHTDCMLRFDKSIIHECIVFLIRH